MPPEAFRFANINHLEDSCQSAWQELSGEDTKISKELYEKVLRGLYQRYHGEVADEEYIQADARQLIKQLM
ncbi:hypothetical protein C0583_00585 [Candidatus Parcubacteria bacterium]|nr:MAG: hypothetical protein C0583_00585 [Candidatus Parcubacteria bacterium]